MSTDKHFNEPSGMPEPLEDNQPTDMKATISLFAVIVILGSIAIAAMAWIYYTQ
ncbi:MAG: hypothetical protein H6591_06575 [Flavobacteriales bacterium]|nr:hypothetical protein [Flavobacteriales bacterium]